MAGRTGDDGKADMRLTLTRETAALFEQHPLPWNGSRTEGRASIWDNNDNVVVDAVRPLLVEHVWNMCKYVRSWGFSPFIPTPLERVLYRTWVPRVLARHPLPWHVQILDIDTHPCRILQDHAGNRIITTWLGESTDGCIDVCYQLSLLAEDVQYRQQRGLL